MQTSSNRQSSLAGLGIKWLLLSLAFVWLVGCVGLNSKARKQVDKFADHKFSCGEEMPPARTSAPVSGPRG
ncbi:MAG: hypothetical protein JSS49_29770 [Planctomycetes bacterium]|nr:hypothetical protein [Planctomycetota bacterium]